MEHSRQPDRTDLRALIAAVLLGGCGESGDHACFIEGRLLSDAYVANAVVCIDANDNLQCDAEEVSARTDTDGTFRLHVTVPPPYDLLAINTLTNLRGDANATYAQQKHLESIGESAYISPLSTLARYTQEPISELLGLSENILYTDYVSLHDTRAIAMSRLIQDTQLHFQKYHGVSESLPQLQQQIMTTLIHNTALLQNHAGLLGAALGGSAVHLRDTDSDMSIEWEPSLEIARGYDALEETPISGSSCAQLKPDANRTAICSNQTQYSFELIDTEQDLLDQYHIGARASLDVIVASAHGSVNFVKTVMQKRNKVYVLVKNETQLCDYMYDASDFNLSESDTALFSSNNPAFRTSCGDGFLGKVQSGGRFVGLFQLDYDNEAYKKDMTVSLKAKVLGVTVYHHTFKDRVDSLLSEFKASYVIDATTGDQQSDYATDANAFYQAHDNFLAHLNGDACSLANGYDSCKYLATFYDYGLIDPSLFSLTAAAQLVLDDYNQLAVSYDTLESDLDFIETRPLLFPYTSTDTISNVRGILALGKSVLKQYAQQCEANSTQCTPLAQITTLQSAQTLRDTYHIPDPEFAPYLTCKELAKDNPSDSNSSSVTLYAERNLSKPFSALCTDMATDTPLTQLPLVHHQLYQEEPITFFRYNYGIAMPLSNPTDATSHTMVRYFDAVTIEPCSPLGECFTVSDAEGFTQITPATQADLFDSSNNPVGLLPYGSAIYDGDAAPPAHPLLNMDLSDTTFHFGSFTAPAGASLTLDNGGKTLNVTATGKSIINFSDAKIYYDAP